MGLLLQEEDFLQRVALTLHSGYWKSKLKFNLFYLYCVMYCIPLREMQRHAQTLFTCTATKRKMWVHFTWIHCCSQVQSWRHLISLYFARKIRNRFIETHANINGDAVDEAKTSEMRVDSESVQHCSLHSLCLYKDYKLFSSKYKEQFWVSTFMNYIYIMLFLFLRKYTVYCVDFKPFVFLPFAHVTHKF